MAAGEIKAGKRFTSGYRSRGLPSSLLQEIDQVEGLEAEAIELSQHRIDRILVPGDEIQDHAADPLQCPLPKPHRLQGLENLIVLGQAEKAGSHEFPEPETEVNQGFRK